MSEQPDLQLGKKLIWNRRYKAWRVWFYALVLVALVCVWQDALSLFKEYAVWSTVGLIALIGGLSATDFIKLKNGSSE